MSRIVNAGSLCYCQVDFYDPIDSINRVVGIPFASLNFRLFNNNQCLLWSLADGTTIVDSSVSPGVIYFNEISSDPGCYSIRFFPNQVGYWRLMVTHIGLGVERILDFDVIPLISGSFNQNSGLIASFTK